MLNYSAEWLAIHDKLNNKILHIEESYNQNTICDLRRQLNAIIIMVNAYTIYNDLRTCAEIPIRQASLGIEIIQDIKKLEDQLLLAYLSYEQ